ncbi:MAG: hypothetical protein AB7N29_17165 [Vicinamibacterales bacterium]
MLRCWRTRGLGVGLVMALVTLSVTPAAAQWLPEQPLTLAGGRVVVGAEASATFAPEDPGFYNYTSYEFSALRNFRLGVAAEVRANDRVQVLGEVRVDQGRVVEMYGLYVRVRPWPARRFDLQAGRIPPTFGAMTRSAYGSGNLLIGQPLAYQYLTSIRPDALPASSDDLLRMRGRGWLSDFPTGNPEPAPGLPIVNTSRWDTGVQAHGVVRIFEWSGSVTTGSLSDPRWRDNNDGRQLAGRLAARPHASLQLGVSASRGAWLNRSLDEAGAANAGSARQVAFGADAEYSAGRVLVRGEVIRSTWHLPDLAAPAIGGSLTATSALIEGRYKVAPGFYVALRGDRIDFSSILGSRLRDTWDADTWRVEAGAGYSVTRNIMLKGAWQRNRRDGGRVLHDDLVAAQVVYWF